jgi:hypothetical protein
LFLAAVVCSPPASSGTIAAEPYGLRGFRLGISLAEFKATVFPDQGVWPGAKPLCSIDPGVNSPGVLSAADSIQMSDAEAKAGLVRCGFFYPSGTALAPAGLVVVSAKASVSFVFVPDASGTLRLASIKATTANSNYDAIKSALGQKYGRPKSLMRGFVQNAAGADFDEETARWSNGTSDIQLVQRDTSMEMMSIEYLHEGLASDGLKRLKAVLGNSPNTL